MQKADEHIPKNIKDKEAHTKLNALLKILEHALLAHYKLKRCSNYKYVYLKYKSHFPSVTPRPEIIPP